jgi:hypothetical protein
MKGTMYMTNQYGTQYGNYDYRFDDYSYGRQNYAQPYNQQYCETSMVFTYLMFLTTIFDFFVLALLFMRFADIDSRVNNLFTKYDTFLNTFQTACSKFVRNSSNEQSEQESKDETENDKSGEEDDDEDDGEDDDDDGEDVDDTDSSSQSEEVEEQVKNEETERSERPERPVRTLNTMEFRTNRFNRNLFNYRVSRLPYIKRTNNLKFTKQARTATSPFKFTFSEQLPSPTTNESNQPTTTFSDYIRDVNPECSCCNDN